MTAKRGEPRRAVVILGEDDNDRKTIQILVAALRPDISCGDMKPLRKPMALVRNVPPSRLPSQADRDEIATLKVRFRFDAIRYIFTAVSGA